MQSRLRGVKALVRSTKSLVAARASMRVFSTAASPSSTVYEHISNMKTQDLFQFEPFNDSDLVVSRFGGFPRSHK